ncbi:MAG: Methyltransferase type 11 [uncultured Thermomicrobiales bacterium]|uniref:Methyltransferase type 11 n=1 Tax=uncultured Thermomicrobiales bacterium TaxID=1645740 RepID=A0A6J4TF23_9BACT|nr:MAG: Methyltransferase type 11 [uncultured Thermomicrobiales bacterium]
MSKILTAPANHAAQTIEETPIASPAPDLAAIKRKQQQTWATGDYAVVGSTLVVMAEQLCEAVDPRAGQRILDVATGHGNAALAAARRFCEVTAIDYVPALLERGRQRAAAEGLEVAFAEGDAENIPFPDASFDIVFSTLGAMFAPDQEKAAAELLRVCRPGGKVGLANWTPDGFIGEMFRVTGRHVPPPARPQAAGAVGHRGAAPGPLRRRGRRDASGAAQLRLPLPLVRPLAGGLPDLLRPGAQGLWGARRGRADGLRRRTPLPGCAVQSVCRRHDRRAERLPAGRGRPGLRRCTHLASSP